MKDFSFDQHLGRGIPLMSGMYTWLFPWKFSHIYSSYEPQKVQLHTKTLEMHVLWRISACFQTRGRITAFSPTRAVGCVVWLLCLRTQEMNYVAASAVALEFVCQHRREEGTFLTRLQKVGSWDQSIGNEEDIRTKSCWAQYPGVLGKGRGLTGRTGNDRGKAWTSDASLWKQNRNLHMLEKQKLSITEKKPRKSMIQASE